MNKCNLPTNIKPIPGYTGYYVSTSGDMYSDFIPGIGSRHGSKLRPKSTVTRKNGYVKTDLYIAVDTKVTRNIHKLVAITHIPNPLHLPLINHKDFVRSNNDVGNLEWCTHADNMAYNKTHGRTTTDIKNGMAKLTWEKVEEIRCYYREQGGTYQDLSKVFGINPKRLGKLVKNKIWVK